MKAGADNFSLANANDGILISAQDGDTFAHLRYNGGADENGGHWLIESFDGHCIFETMDLSPEGIAANFDIKEPQGVLVGALHFSSEHDHAHAGSPDGHSFTCLMLDDFAQTEPLQELSDGRAFAAGDDQV